MVRIRQITRVRLLPGGRLVGADPLIHRVTDLADVLRLVLPETVGGVLRRLVQELIGAAFALLRLQEFISLVLCLVEDAQVPDGSAALVSRTTI